MLSSQINMLEDQYCRVLCQVDLKQKDVTDFKTAIQRQYHHNWIVDNLPAASILDTDQYVSTQYVGYPIGEQPCLLFTMLSCNELDLTAGMLIFL